MVKVINYSEKIRKVEIFLKQNVSHRQKPAPSSQYYGNSESREFTYLNLNNAMSSFKPKIYFFTNKLQLVGGMSVTTDEQDRPGQDRDLDCNR